MTPTKSMTEIRIQVRKLIEAISSRSAVTPPLLRLEAAEKLLEAQQTIDDFLEVLALSEFEDDDE